MAAVVEPVVSPATSPVTSSFLVLRGSDMGGSGYMCSCGD